MAPESKYRREYHDDWAWSLAIKGATNEEIANAFGIAVRTLIRWRRQYQSLDEAVTRGKGIADSKVEKSLFERATGFTAEEKKRIFGVDKEGNPKLVRVETVTKRVPPDTMAIMYWLNNRDRLNWKQKQSLEVSTSPEAQEDVVIYLPKMLTEEDCKAKPCAGSSCESVSARIPADQ